MENGQILDSDIPQHDRVIKRGKGRSRVTNGSKLLPLSDGRSVSGRRFRDIFEDIANDLGGLDRLSEAQKQMIRRAATLSAESERQEAEWANGRPFDLTAYSTTSNCLRRLFETLGVQRQPRQVNDGSHVLAAYFAVPPPKEGGAA
jgi:hypothetical protein